MSNRFKRPETNPLMNPVDFYNFYGNPYEIWHEAKDCRFKDDMRPRLMDMLDEEYRQHGRRFLN